MSGNYSNEETTQNIEQLPDDRARVESSSRDITTGKDMAYRDIPEIECIPEVCGPDVVNDHKNCLNSDEHEHMIPVDKLTMEHLPKESQNPEVMKVLQLACDYTVKITTIVTSHARPDTFPNTNSSYPYSDIKGTASPRCGTGVFYPPSLSTILDTSKFESKTCPCHICKESEEPEEEYVEVLVVTSTHVIFDDEEAKHARIECFYDSDDKKDVKCLYGIDVILTESQKCETDFVLVKAVTHDVELIEKLIELNNRDNTFNPPTRATVPRGYVISHPHGMSKRISFGNILYNKIPVDPAFPPGVPHTFGTCAKYRLPADPLDGNSVISIEPNTTFTLPKDSKYFCTFKQPWKSLVSKWVTFPEGTKFTLPHGNDACFPKDAEFSWEELDIYTTYHSYHYLVYDIPTCRGSSGAPILHLGGDWIYTYATHSGINKSDFNKRSSLNLLPDFGADSTETDGGETEANGSNGNLPEETKDQAFYDPGLETQEAIIAIQDRLMKNIRKMDALGNVYIEISTNIKSISAGSDYILLKENNTMLDKINRLLGQMIDERNASQGDMDTTTCLSLMILVHEICVIFFSKLKLAVEWMIYFKKPTISTTSSVHRQTSHEGMGKVNRRACKSFDTLKILLDTTQEMIEKLKALLTERKTFNAQWNDLNREMESIIIETTAIPPGIKKLLSEKEATFQNLHIVCEENHRFSELRRKFFERSHKKEHGVNWTYYSLRGKQYALRRKQYLIKPKLYLEGCKR